MQIETKKPINYSAEDRNKIVLEYHSQNSNGGKISLRKFAKDNNIHRESLTKWIKAYNKGTLDNYGERTKRKNDHKPISGGYITPPNIEREELKGSRFVFTSAQNNTDVHKGFFDNLQSFCKTNNAKMIIGRYSYNKNAYQNVTKDSDDLWYDPKVTPYVIDRPVNLSKSKSGLVWCGELDIIPTAVKPLSQLDSYTGVSSSIVPHAKVQLQSVPVLKGDDIKIMYTTGTCTKRNYIQRKAGQKAEFHHVFGALYVEIDNEGNHFCRQLIADSAGNFYDLDRLYQNGKVLNNQTIEAVTWGDIHSEMIDDDVANGSWRSEKSILNVLKPSYQFVHDLTDFKARNHHNIRNPHSMAERYFNGEDSVEDGMMLSAQVLKELSRDYCETIVVESNHDQAFKRWLSEADIKTDPANAEYFHLANAEVFKHIRLNKPFHVFEWAVRKFCNIDNIKFLGEDDSFVVCGIENAMHGHRGTNGARGSALSFDRLGRKTNTAHSHSALIYNGSWVAGISCSLDMGYNKGASSWSHSHILTYPNGKRAIVTMRGSKWRA